MDDRVRAAERVWRESGRPEDEARWLVERLRAGDLPRERLERAADPMNHLPALLALGAPTFAERFPDALTRPLWGPPDPERLAALDPVPGDPCVRCWAGALEDADEPPAHRGPVYSPNGEEHDWVHTSGPYGLACAACGARFTGRGARKTWRSDDRVTYERDLDFYRSWYGAPPRPAPAEPLGPPRRPPPPPSLWQRLGAWLTGG
ncbi:MAG: hypothetical protein M9894_27635 [Planctomycetes bacterium]|nr:hypothetical protein [Planctomycetota bacterium]